MSTTTTTAATIDQIEELLGPDARDLLEHECEGIKKADLHHPGPDFVDRVLAGSDRPIPVLRSFQQLLSTGRLAGTGYVSILPVDQGIEHSGGASFAKNPAYFDPENIVKLAIEGGCNAVASTLGVLGAVGRKYAHKIPFILKFNHNELHQLPEPLRPDPVRPRRAGGGHGCGRRRRHDLLRLRGVDAARSRRSARPSRRRTSWGWSPSSGATCGTAPSRPRRRTTTSRPT